MSVEKTIFSASNMILPKTLHVTFEKCELFNGCGTVYGTTKHLMTNLISISEVILFLLYAFYIYITLLNKIKLIKMLFVQKMFLLKKWNIYKCVLDIWLTHPYMSDNYYPYIILLSIYICVSVRLSVMHHHGQIGCEFNSSLW